MESDNYYYNKDLKEFARRLRKNSTKAEVVLWKEVLRGAKMQGYTFLRQRPIKNYIVDFMCKKLRLIIEVDGITHHREEQWKLDKQRESELDDIGFSILRFTDNEVLGDLKNVERMIGHWVLNHPTAPPSKGERSSPSQKGGKQ